MDEIMKKAVELAVDERLRQNEKWGDQSGNHPFEWMSILMEEVGELAEAVNETCFSSPHMKPGRGGRDAILREAVQVAAVALAIAEATIKAENGKEGHEDA
jgi:NTP pyrophosphatase (non-canonical NTP hydrolase)